MLDKLGLSLASEHRNHNVTYCVTKTRIDVNKSLCWWVSTWHLSVCITACPLCSQTTTQNKKRISYILLKDVKSHMIWFSFQSKCILSYYLMLNKPSLSGSSPGQNQLGVSGNDGTGQGLLCADLFPAVHSLYERSPAQREQCNHHTAPLKANDAPKEWHYREHNLIKTFMQHDKTIFVWRILHSIHYRLFSDEVI